MLAPTDIRQNSKCLKRRPQDTFFQTISKADDCIMKRPWAFVSFMLCALFSMDKNTTWTNTKFICMKLLLSKLNSKIASKLPLNWKHSHWRGHCNFVTKGLPTSVAATASPMIAATSPTAFDVRRDGSWQPPCEKILGCCRCQYWSREPFQNQMLHGLK